jgi:hypothetical protein
MFELGSNQRPGLCPPPLAFFCFAKKSGAEQKKALRCEAAQAEKQKKKKTFLSVFEVLQT